MNIRGLVHVNINCSDFDRSREFYEALGFELFLEAPETNAADVEAAVDLPDYRLRGGLMRLRDAKIPFVLDLLEWQIVASQMQPAVEKHAAVSGRKN